MANTDDVKGRVKEAVGDLTSNKDLQREGKADQTSGNAKDKIDDLADKAKGRGRTRLAPNRTHENRSPHELRAARRPLHATAAGRRRHRQHFVRPGCELVREQRRLLAIFGCLPRHARVGRDVRSASGHSL
jgi:uncharacterized protein YjbJ (UPF0337 family)